MGILVLIWCALFVGLVSVLVRNAAAGGVLVLAYFLALSLIHLPGALVYLDPQSGLANGLETEAGFLVTLIGMGAFIGGALLALMTNREKPQPPRSPSEVSSNFAPWFWPIAAMGAFFYFFVRPRADAIPSGSALVSAFGTLIVIAFWIRLYAAKVAGDSVKVFTTLAALPSLPAATLFLMAFINFGAQWAIEIAALFFLIIRKRLWFYVGSPLVALGSMSVFTAYMAVRLQIRDAVWNDRGFAEKLSSLTSIFDHLQFPDLTAPEIETAINLRLNQNYFVGSGVQRYEAGAVDLLHGSTVELWALIPRALWPDKPRVGGGGDLVANFLGLQFEAGTSVGVGQPLEFYMNFAMPGVIIGFLVWGYVLMWLDLGLMRSLRNGDMRGLLLYAMPGLTMIEPVGNLLEILVATIGAAVSSRALIALGLFGTAQRNAATPRYVPAE